MGPLIVGSGSSAYRPRFMAPADETKLASAYYEAGTAVIARTLGLRVAWTTIQSAEGPAGHTELDDWWEDAEPTGDTVAYRTKLSMVALAGRESVAAFTGSRASEPRADDRVLGLGGAELQERVRSLIADDESLRAEIKAVAAVLLDEGWLDSVQLDEVRRTARDQGGAHPVAHPVGSPVLGPRKLRRAGRVRARRRRIGELFRH